MASYELYVNQRKIGKMHMFLTENEGFYEYTV